MFEEIIEVFKAVCVSEFFSTIAKAYRVSYLELIKEGFSEEQAMAIITSQGLSVNTK